MKRMVLAVLILLTMAMQAQADTLKGNYFACRTAQLFDEMMTLQARNDERGMAYLLGHGCIVTRPGLGVSVLGSHSLGTVKVRVYADDGDSMVMWTNVENVQKD